jgi:hypothetical protein
MAMATVKDAIETMKQNIASTTGKTVDAWIAASRKSGFAKHGDGGDDELLTAQYAGAKQALAPIYEHLVSVLKKLGPDVEIAVKKNNVSIRRTKQFALLQPSTATRLDVGLILKGVKPTDRLEAAGSFNAMFTHRVRIGSIRDVDADFKAWARQAYEAA